MRWFVVLPVLALLACDSDSKKSDDDEETTDDPCGEPFYGGKATDEAWKAIVDAYGQAKVGDPQAVTVTTPTADQTLPAATPATFSWTSPIALETHHAPADPTALAAAAERRARHDEGWLAGALHALGDFFVGTAHAHLPPITGDIYYVEVTIPGRDCKVRALTTDLTWTPSAADWAIIAAGSGTLTLTVTSAYLQENVITEGPYRPTASTSFEVQ